MKYNFFLLVVIVKFIGFTKTDRSGWIGLVQHLTANERETNELHICAFINILFVRRLAPQI